MMLPDDEIEEIGDTCELRKALLTREAHRRNVQAYGL
jgi:hypothetical protein